jgi:hypothetical protein
MNSDVIHILNSATAETLGKLGEVAAGVLPVGPELRHVAGTLLGLFASELAKLATISPRVDVVAGPNAVITVTLHDTEDPGAAPDMVPVDELR